MTDGTDATRIKPAAADATRIEPAAGDATRLKPGTADSTAVKPAAPPERVAAAERSAPVEATRLKARTTGGPASTGSDWSHPEEWESRGDAVLGPGSVVKQRFALESVLGRGGMGVVYKARQTLPRRVEVRELDGGHGERPRAARDQHPAEALAALHHRRRRLDVGVLGRREDLHAVERRQARRRNGLDVPLAAHLHHQRRGLARAHAGRRQVCADRVAADRAVEAGGTAGGGERTHDDRQRVALELPRLGAAEKATADAVGEL